MNELFEKRGAFERELGSASDERQKEAYTELAKIILQHKTLIVKSEMSRLARERLFFNPNTRQYNRLVEQSRRVNGDTIDNLVKMTLHINKLAKSEKLQEAYREVSGNSFVLDIEEGDIEQRIPQNEARRLLVEWKKILVKYHEENPGVDVNTIVSQEGSPELESLKDKLFIVTGED